MSRKTNREHLVAIRVERGIITLIDVDGEIRKYLQRGIKKLEPSDKVVAVSYGLLDSNFGKYPELPYNYSISFEDPEIMGRAFATFNPGRK